MYKIVFKVTVAVPLVHYSVQKLSLVGTLMKISVPYKAGGFLD